MARIEAKSMPDRMMCTDLIYQWIIAFEFAGDYGAFGVAVDSGVLDKDHIKLDSILFSSNQIFY